MTRKVGINAFALGTSGGGIETYVRNVISQLGVLDPDGDYTLLVQEPVPRYRIPHTAHMRRVVVRTRYKSLRIPLASALAVALARLDLLHVQNAAPALCPGRIIVTLHDIAFDVYPDFLPPDSVAALRRQVPWTLRRAAAVITDSEASRREIMRRYRVPPEKMTVALLAADPIFRPVYDAGRLAAVRTHYAANERFILFTGDPLQRRKNVKTLVEAYVRLRQAGSIEQRLLLTGDRSALDSDIFAALRASGYEETVSFVGRVADEDLVALYNAADLFVYPSFYEGFGLPPLEAMACGTPVITSNVSSLPEVVSDAGITVDPFDVEALARTIGATLGDEGLRTRLSRLGLDRAASFSWRATAGKILDVYHSVYKNR